MTDTREKQEYMDQLKRLGSGIGKILDLPANRIVTPEISASLAELKNKAELLHRKLDTGEFEIAVVGLEKAGKSSFSNALAGLQILPTADARCTYTSTCVRPGDKNSATVSFMTLDDLNRDLKDKLKTLEIPNAESWNLDNLTLQKYEQMFSETAPTIQRLYGETLNTDITELLANKASLRQYLNRTPQTFNEEELASSNFKDFIVNPAKAMAVREIVIHSTELKDMPNAVLYDVPGFDSPTAMHRQQTLEKMNSADAIIAVANAKSPSINGPSLDVFKQPDMEGNALSDKLFVFANKADLVNTAEDLRKNMQTINSEWIDKWKILAADHARRISAGSAFAAEGDAAAQAKLAELGIDDGISAMRERLADYNNNERFNVLKRRIGKLVFDVQSIFESSGQGYMPESRERYDSQFSLILLELMDRLRPELSERLNSLRAEMNNALDHDKPLSKDIKARIAELITTSKYGLEDEETRKLHEKYVGVNVKTEMPITIDSNLRSLRFQPMYREFCDQVQGSAIERHRKVSDNIRKVFMDVFGIGENSSAYAQLGQEVEKFCGFGEEHDASYYDSLLERFGRDLFEILVMHSQGQERLNKFRQEMPNFFSMGVYFDAHDGDVSNASPLDSMFWRLLLYPELAKAPSLEELIEKIKSDTGLPRIGGALQQLLAKLLMQKGSAALREIDKITRALPLGSNEARIASALKQALELAIEESADNVNEILEGGYLKDVQERRGNFTYKSVRDEFANDIEALRVALTRTFIPAVNMEKAFAARESGRIERIRDSLGEKEFRSFISRNIGIIESAKLGELRQEEAERQADAAVMNEIRSILAEIGKKA